MKINENIKIVGNNVILIPYESNHVEKYHEWMKSPELQELTASEPLTLQEEYEMQQSWRNDEDKCTFLILDKEKYINNLDEIEALIGDINLFLQFDEDGCKLAEAEIMIAEQSSRRKHFGWESMLLMLKYGVDNLNIEKFIVKISVENTKSINMFEKMEFTETSRSNVFKEITFQRSVNDSWTSWLNDQISLYLIENYK